MKRAYTMFAVAVLVSPIAAGAQSTGFPDIPAIARLDLTCTSPNPTFAATATAPMALAIAQSGGTTACVNLSSFFTPAGKLWSFNAVGVNIGGLGTADLTSLMNPDPFITFGAVTTNIVAGPVTYAFLFGTPVVPGIYNNATSTAGVSVTNGASGTSGVTTSAVYPSYVSGYGTNGVMATNLGVDLGTLPCTAGPGAPFTVTQTCNQGSLSNNFAPTFFDNLELLLTYSQTDIGSTAAWSGAVTLNATVVPEPATLALVATGLVGLAAIARRRASA